MSDLESAEEVRYSRNPFILSFAAFQIYRDKKVLEIGVGTGTDFAQFAKSRACAVGIDISLKSLQICRRRLSTRGFRPDIILADGEYLPFISDYFDLVYSCGVIHHSVVPERVVKEAYRVMNSGAVIKVMVYHKYSLVCLRKLMFEILFKHRIPTSLDEVLSEELESKRTRAYSLSDARRLFTRFKGLTVHPILTYYDLGFLAPRFLRRFGDHVGFFILVSALK